MALSRSPRCAFCNSSNEGHLSRCAACSVVHYCNRNHQAAHRDAHKRVCNGIKKALQVLEKEETKLRAHPADWMTPPNLFEESVGHFWGILETRPYMRSRYAVVEAYLAIDTYAAVEAARSHLADMLRLCRGDNMGVRDVVPATLLRLGQIKNVTTFATELISYWPKVPQEILDSVRSQLVTTVVSNNAKIMKSVDQTPLVKEIEKQVQALYIKAQQQNMHFWPTLLNPGRNLGARPNSYSPGSPQHMQLILNYSYNSWKETPGAIETIGKLRTPNPIAG
ncbi:MAG: hypothetical protein Q9226_003923 [Calogaya cf. arnoldii]